jgi:hypothetical protein
MNYLKLILSKNEKMDGDRVGEKDFCVLSINVWN